MSTLAVDAITNAAGTSAATIDSSGKISTTQGFLPKAYAFRATKHVAINWTSGGGTGNAVTFNNTSSNDAFNSGFNLNEIGTTGKVYLPVDGIYRVSANFLVSSSNTSNATTYVVVAFNATDGSGGAPGTTLLNDYTYVPAGTHRLVKLDTIFKGTTSDYFTICKHDTIQYWGPGTNINSSSWGYNQLTCELIGVSQ